MLKSITIQAALRDGVTNMGNGSATRSEEAQLLPGLLVDDGGDAVTAGLSPPLRLTASACRGRHHADFKRGTGPIYWLVEADLEG